MVVKEYDALPQAAASIRNDVFVKEQGFVDEFDDVDAGARHIVLYDGDQPISTCRIYFNSDKQSFVVGRIAVIRQYRGKNYGAKTLSAAEDVIRRDGGKSVLLAAQVRATVFYEKQGYAKQGDEFMEEDCPHIWMIKRL